MSDYEAKLLAAAHKDGLTASVVAKLSYVGTAPLCGVTIKPNGDSPADFFYENIRRAVARDLAREEWLATVEGTRADIEATLLSAGVSGRVYVDEEGNIVVVVGAT